MASLTHLFGAFAFAVLGAGLIQRGQGDSLRVAALIIYVSDVVSALLLSGLMHLVDRDSGARSVLVRLDHAAIFFLIAATYTPVHIIQFRGWMRWGVLVGALIDVSALPALVPGLIRPHEVFHVFVLAGVAAHWVCIRRITVFAPITDLYDRA